MIRLCRYLIVVCIFCGFCSLAAADDDRVKGDPETLWRSPLSDSKIEINDYNRCQIIKAVLPGIGKTSEFSRQNYELLSEYISNLYAQSIKTGVMVDEEKNNPSTDFPDLSNEIKLMEYVTMRSGDIARRINIINSLEAGTTVIEALTALQALPPRTFEKYDNCEELK